MTAKETPTSPADQLVETLVYGPVGLALDAVDNWSSHVERGRSQVTIGRFLAKTAANKGGSAAESLIEKLVNDASQVVVDLLGIDLSPDDEATPGPDASVSPLLPIADYDELTAATIVTQLAGLSTAQLDVVRAHEEAGRSRVTILRKIDQLQA
ncbi:MAG: hypothetical protein HKN94_07475 [Acidimicrobiales bacterium]|nr:hypothetical protein [Acidimicrobiales bacterium]RZV47079.1 MAG: hypothetical protein EX269_05605 [Acidimicrobiales bacterium]